MYVAVKRSQLQLKITFTSAFFHLKMTLSRSEKAHIGSALFLRSFAKVVHETVPIKQSDHTSSVQEIAGLPSCQENLRQSAGRIEEAC